MKTKFKTCTPEFLEDFKMNFEEKYLKLYENLDKEAILNIFENDPLVYDAPDSYDFDYVPLEYGVYAQNVRAIYDSLKMLNPVEAAREENWFTMINTVYIDYLMDYLETKRDKKNFTNEVKNAIFYMQGKTRAQLVQRICRFWWIGLRTYDETHLQDPYWLTKFFVNDDAMGKAVSFFSSKLTNNKALCLGTIEAIYERQDVLKNSKYPYTYMNKHLNALGGVKILDVMTREQVKKEILEYIDYILENPQEIPEKDRKKVFLNWK